MGYIVRMPKLGLEMEAGTVLEWSIDEEGAVEEGDLLAEIESEKSIGEVEARESGVLRRIYVAEGETVPPGTSLGIVAAPDADVEDLAAEAEAELADEAVEVEVESGATAEAKSGADAPSGDAGAAATGSAGSTGNGAGDASGSAGSTDAASDSGDVKASPRAECRAEELGVDLAAVEGTGPGGAITADDVETAAGSAATEPTAGGDGAGEPAADPDDVKASPRAERRAEELDVDLTAVEGTGPGGAVTADDVETAAEAEGGASAEAAEGDASTEPAESDATAEPAADEAAGRGTAVEPAIEGGEGAVRRLAPDRAIESRYGCETTVADPAAAEALLAATGAVRRSFEVDVSITDVLVVLVAEALADHPEFNATFAEETHQLREERHVALVVGDDGELRAPVLRNAGELSLSEVTAARRALVGGADRDDGDSPRATFTLANLAQFRDDGVGALANPPGVACLAVHPGRKRAIPGEDGVDLRPHVTATLTYDARAVDGAAAERFLDGLFAAAERAPELIFEGYRGEA